MGLQKAAGCTRAVRHKNQLKQFLDFQGRIPAEFLLIPLVKLVVKEEKGNITNLLREELFQFSIKLKETRSHLSFLSLKTGSSKTPRESHLLGS